MYIAKGNTRMRDILACIEMVVNGDKLEGWRRAIDYRREISGGWMDVCMGLDMGIRF